MLVEELIEALKKEDPKLGVMIGQVVELVGGMYASGQKDIEVSSINGTIVLSPKGDQKSVYEREE
jgi:hypothetical protein